MSVLSFVAESSDRGGHDAPQFRIPQLLAVGRARPRRDRGIYIYVVGISRNASAYRVSHGKSSTYILTRIGKGQSSLPRPALPQCSPCSPSAWSSGRRIHSPSLPDLLPGQHLFGVQDLGPGGADGLPVLALHDAPVR